MYYCPMTSVIKNKKKRMDLFLAFIQGRYTDPRCELVHTDAYELLCATILSAQCTDKQVNKITPALFEKYPTVQSLSIANVTDVEELVKSTGFYKNKAKNLVGMAIVVMEKHNGEIPKTLAELVLLPGVGRKTANVLLGNIHNIPGMVVDTHVLRTANRLKFVDSEDPIKVEKLLEKLVKKSEWVNFSHQVILLGRELCPARNPKCAECPFNDTATI